MLYEVHLYRRIKVVLQHTAIRIMAVSTYQPYFTVRRLSRRGFCSCVCLPAVFHTVPTVSPGRLLSYAFAGRMSHRADCLAGACAVVCTCRPYVIPRRLSRQGFCSCVRRAMRLCPGQFSQLPADRRNLRYLSLLPKHLP